VIGYTSLSSSTDLYSIETVPGERRAIALDDGSRIHLNGASRVTLDRESPRFARLERGEALFEVVHKDADPFRVEAGEASIEDLGTVFNVSRREGAVSVAVAEGAVAISSGSKRVALSEGMAAKAEGGAIATGRQDLETIGTWRRGVLSYSSAPLSQVILDLSRSAGLQLALSPQLRGRRFTGVIMLDADRKTLLRRVPALLGVDIRPAPEGWLLVPAAS
jgi:transmembrane sensor